MPRIPLIPSDYQLTSSNDYSFLSKSILPWQQSAKQILKVAGVDLKNDSFFHTNMYVACSYISFSDSSVVLQPGETTKYIVYKEVLWKRESIPDIL